MTDIAHYKPLTLRAHDAEDLELFSTYLQDGIVPITSMSFDAKEGLFTCLVNRFCWELVQHFDLHESYYRVHSGLTFKNVTSVSRRNFDQNHHERTLNLLMISLIVKSEGDYSVRLLFSGDRELDIFVSSPTCIMHDFHHPWPTKKKPMHIHEHIEELKKIA